MKSVAIITARGGSKRIPLKNIRLFLDRPIIEYVIKAAKLSGCFDEVMVSTDDSQIAKVAIDCGATVPFMRSEETSNDYATTSEAISEVLNEYAKLGKQFDFFCCIFPTAPFITSDRLKEAYDLLSQSDADSVIPVTSFTYPILRSFKIVDGKLYYNWPEYISTRSQNLEPAYHDSGQFYMVRTSSFLEQRQIVMKNVLALYIPESEVQDIDKEEDWKIAEMKYKIMMSKYGKS